MPRPISPRMGRATVRAQPGEPEEQSVPAVAGGTSGLSYSVRICGHCRKPAEPDGAGGARCPSCGRTRGWL